MSSPWRKICKRDFYSRRKSWSKNFTVQVSKFMNARIGLKKLLKDHLNYWNSWRMPSKKLKHWSNTSLISSKELLSTSPLRMTRLIRNLLSTSTTTQRDQSWRSCSWEKVKVFINSDLREYMSELTKIRSTVSYTSLCSNQCYIVRVGGGFLSIDEFLD